MILLLSLVGCSNTNNQIDSPYLDKIDSAVKLLEEGKENSAIISLKEAIELDKTQDKAYLELYKIYYNQEEYLKCDLLLKEGLSNTNSDEIKKASETLYNNEIDGIKYEYKVNDYNKTNTIYDKYLGYYDNKLPLIKDELHYDNIFKNTYSIMIKYGKDLIKEVKVYPTNFDNGITYTYEYNGSNVSMIKGNNIEYKFNGDGYLENYNADHSYEFEYDGNNITTITSSNQKYKYCYDENQLSEIKYYMNNNLYKEYDVEKGVINSISIYENNTEIETELKYDQYNRMVYYKWDDGKEEVEKIFEYNELLSSLTTKASDTDFVLINKYQYSEDNKKVEVETYNEDNILIQKYIEIFDDKYNLISTEYENLLPDEDINLINDESYAEILKIANDYLTSSNYDNKITGLYNVSNKYYIVFENIGYTLISDDSSDHLVVQEYTKDMIFPLVDFYYLKSIN